MKPARKKKTARALETGFPSEELHALAELESWRKEVNRPIYHIHKWWANRLGSVFRAIVLAGNLDSSSDVWAEFYSKENSFKDRIVLDPFMGSGTTVGEALKLGCRAVGVDINPVSYFQVRKAIEAVDIEALQDSFSRLEKRIRPKIDKFYKSVFEGVEAEILYTFWVKSLTCPQCNKPTRLFGSWIFSANAYPKRKPESKAICPKCGEINVVNYYENSATCSGCTFTFDPHKAPANHQSFNCEHCSFEGRILEVVRASGKIPKHEMYDLMLLLPDGRKVYKKPDDSDKALYEAAATALKRMLVPVLATLKFFVGGLAPPDAMVKLRAFTCLKTGSPTATLTGMVTLPLGVRSNNWPV
jgi:putative DNA methylase